jgi:hypothetical protein
MLGCPISESNKCCFECDKQQDCKEKDKDCKGMPKQYKECNFYDDL